MSTNKNKTLVLLTIITTLGLSACSDDKAGNAGKSIDNAVSEMKDATSDMGESIKDVATDAGNALEDACENVKDGLSTQNKNC